MSDHLHEPEHGHGHGLAEDLPLMQAMVARRRALKWFAGAGTAAMVAGCGGGSGTDASASSVGVVTGATATPTPTPTATATTAATGSTPTTGCIADPAETAGPYPADGTNNSNGSTSNVLTVSGVVRSDIRSSFVSTTTVAGGVLLKITLTVVNVNANCAPLAGYAVYLWHCDRVGNYSLYGSAAAESFLRGVQVTDANGQVTFTTIYPGCYAGRFPHMHFEIFSSLSNALGGRFSILTSQLAMPAAASSAVYADTALYPSSASNAARVSLSNDGIFGDNTPAQIAQQTLTLSGSPSAGYTGGTVIGIAR